MAIRDSIDRVIAKRADTAAQVFQLEKNDALDKIIAPYAPLAGQTADIITTGIALQKGLTEANPLMKPLVKHFPVFVVVKLGLGVVMAVQVKKLQDNGHKNAARIVSAISTLAGAGPAISNLIQMNK